MREKNAAPLQLGNVVMSERSPLKPAAAERHTFQPEHPLVLRVPNHLHLENLLRVQLGGRERFLGRRAAGSADQRMIEKLLELLGGCAQIVQVRHFADSFFAAIRAFSPSEQVRGRNPQHGSGLKEIALGRVLQDIQLLLGQVALNVKPRPDADGNKVDIESGGRRWVVPDFNPVFVVNLQRGGISGVERLFELSRSSFAGLEPDAIDFDSSLQGINMQGGWFEHDAVLNECGESAQARLRSFRALNTPDHQVSQVIEPNFEAHLEQARSVSLRDCRGRHRGRLVRNNGRVVFVDLEFQLHDSLGIAQPDLLPVNLDRTVRQDVERLRRFNQSARDPFISVHMDPGLAWIERHRFPTETQSEYLGVSFSVLVFVGLDSWPLGRRYDSNECYDDCQGQANREERIRRHRTGSDSEPRGDQESIVHTNAS